MRLPLMAFEGGPITVNLVDYPLLRSLGHNVHNKNQGIWLEGPHCFGGPLGEPVEFRHLVIE